MKRRWRAMAFAAALAGWLGAQNASDPLAEGFRHPPDSARPRTWWHWTGGNVTKEGITKDLEWMKRVGIAGFHLADVAAGGGQTVERKIAFGTPEWLDAVRFAASEASRLGLEMTIFSSPGWSETGGPWVKPEQAMKKLVWSETVVEGPRAFAARLPQPPSDNGPIGNLRTGGGRAGTPPDPTYYGDSAVVAYRTPEDEVRMADAHPAVSTQAGPIDAAALFDNDLNTAVTIPAARAGQPAWLQFEFARPFAARAFTIAARGGIPFGRLLAGDDPAHLQTLAVLPGAQLYRGGTERTFAFPRTAARFFRLELTGAPFTPAGVMSQAPPLPAREFALTEAVLYSGARIHRWEEKAGFSFLFEYETKASPPVPSAAAIHRPDIVDLTDRMSKDGSLEWDVPPGRWTILRMGYSLTGAKNRPAGPTGLGFEADKLSAANMEAYFHGYFDPIAQALGPLVGTSLRYMMMDSWEAGMQNWTPDMRSEFQRRRGYDSLPYLPALAGRVVESAEASDRFLWDFRRTLADMFADDVYGTMAGLLRRRGMGVYAEASGVSMEIAEDTLLNKSKVEIPMGEFWVHPLHPQMTYYVDVRGAASAGRLYGQNLVATESFTGGGYEAPATLKNVADYWFAQGVNRLVFHTSAHQPLDTKPGNTMVGTHINRNITWAEQAGPLMDYFARNCFLLQQGKPVADLAYLLNEGAPSTMPFWGAGLRPAPPDGYDFDYVNADALVNRVGVDGNGYRVLVLPETRRMTLPVLHKIGELVENGMTVVGAPPVGSPGLAGYPQVDGEVRALATDIWGDLDGVSRTVRPYGKGTVVWGLPLAEVLARMDVGRDFEYGRPLDAELVWTHRRTRDVEIYYVANQRDSPLDTEVRLRAVGRAAEIWRPDTGDIQGVESHAAAGRTTVALHLDPREALFVVLRGAPSARTAPARKVETELGGIGGPWEVRFPPNLGAPEQIQMAELEPLSASQDAGVKYFSGTASYSRTVQAPAAWFGAGARLWLDLGMVKDVAEVSVNGNRLGILWKPPYRVDVTAALKPGANRIQIQVTDEWTNRILGDRLLPAGRRVLAGTIPAGPGRGGQPLPESGLLGPVRVMRVRGEAK